MTPRSAPAAKIKRLKLALALLMDEHDLDVMVIPADHVDTVAGGVRIEWDSAAQVYRLIRYTTTHPETRAGWPTRNRTG